MSSGFFALLDDIAAIAKVAAASVDDIAAQSLKAGTKAAGIVIDDAAVTPRYVVGFASDRELPIIAKIAWGSLKNKLLYLLPGALALSTLAPWAITPLLMAGGLFLCFEGYEKVHEMMHPHAAKHGDGPGDGNSGATGTTATPSPHQAAGANHGLDPQAAEDAKVASAIRTDFILSAEIMAISLASVATSNFYSQAIILAVVGLMVTVAVYGTVALIVKADDFGVHLAQTGGSELVRGFGRGLVGAMPPFLKGLSVVGMLAMLWVGGGIILHGLADFGLKAIAYSIHGFAAAIGAVFGPLSGLITWLVDAAIAGAIGLVLGYLVAQALALWSARRGVAH